MKSYEYRIRLSDTDAAGRIFFTSACRIAHDAFEQWMADAGFPLDTMILEATYGLPVARVEADYHKSLHLGEWVHVNTTVLSTGTKSVTFQHEIRGSDGKTAVNVRMTHVAVSAKTGKSRTLPKELKKIFSIGPPLPLRPIPRTSAGAI